MGGHRKERAGTSEWDRPTRCESPSELCVAFAARGRYVTVTYILNVGNSPSLVSAAAHKRATNAKPLGLARGESIAPPLVQLSAMSLRDDAGSLGRDLRLRINEQHERRGPIGSLWGIDWEWLHDAARTFASALDEHDKLLPVARGIIRPPLHRRGDRLHQLVLPREKHATCSTHDANVQHATYKMQPTTCRAYEPSHARSSC